ncbi:MAG: translation initiation factor IF-2 subunit beta [Nanoarchaeota archaeon]
MDYEQMLSEGIDALPQAVKTRERFIIPKVKGHVEGNKTIITNFNQIAQTLRRPKEHVVKFLLKEVAAPGDYRSSELILGRKVPSTQINEKIKKYADTYVICNECGKPDTKLTRENNINYLVCQACGNKQVVRG